MISLQDHMTSLQDHMGAGLVHDPPVRLQHVIHQLACGHDYKQNNCNTIIAWLLVQHEG